ncbi:MAG: hypothetical protein PHV33_00710 [Elusimicrobiales bacterium]|nr:hypothetical protein [Elusimicrobiales bacterium]
MRTGKIILAAALAACWAAAAQAAPPMIVLASATYNSVGADDKATALFIDPAGNIFVTGNSGNDYLSLKYTKTLAQGPGMTFTNGRGGNIPGGIAVDGLGNILVAGMETNASFLQDYLLLKYSANFGALLSSASFDSGNFDRATAVKTDGQNNVYVTGYSNDGASDNFYTIKYSPALVQLSTADYESGDQDQAFAMAFNGSDLIVAGLTKAGGTNNNVRLVRYDKELNYLPPSVSFDSGGDDRAVGVAVDSEGNIIVAVRQATTADMLTLKYDSTLTTLISSAVYAGGTPTGVAVDSADNVILTGYTGLAGAADFFTIKYDAALNAVSTAAYNGAASNTDQANAVAVDADDNLVVAGQASTSDFDYFIVKYNASPQLSVVTPLYIGETANVTLTGKGLLADTSVSFTDAGISTGASSYNSGQITLAVTPSAAVVLGVTTITVTNSNGEQYTTAALARTRLRQTIAAGASASITAMTNLGQISISVPAGSFPGLPETITLSPEAAAAGDIQQVGEALFVAGTPSTNSLVDMGITLRYSVADLGGYAEGELSLAYYDSVAGWVTLPSTVDTSAKTVTASAKPANTKYAVIKAVSSGGGGGGGGGGAGGSGIPAKVYPNPYRPGSGGSFDDSALGAGIVFAGLGANQAFKLTIVDLAGQLVFQKSASADAAGKYLWDTKTASGGDATTGVYIYYIKGGGEPVKGKFSIIR